MQTKTDIKYMKEAIAEAKKATANGDAPIGAVIVRDGEIVGRGYNRVEESNDSTAHAELIAIKEAIAHTGYKHLLDCALYVTLEPCSMCSGAIVLARIPRIVYGAEDPKAGASGSLYTITEDARLNHRCEVSSGVLREECSEMLKSFFRDLREKKKG